MDTLFFGMRLLAAIAFDMGGSLLTLGTTMGTLCYGTTLLGHEGEFSVFAEPGISHVSFV